jgi:hypothetical protein
MARAPKNYAKNMMGAPRASAMVWTELVYATCLFVMALNGVHSVLSSHQKEQLKDKMSPGNVADLILSLSMAAHAYIQALYDSSCGCPSPKLE